MSPARPDPAAVPSWHFQRLRAGVPAEQDARAWLAAQLGWPQPSTLPLQRDAHGRPRLQPPLAGDDCNWSHSGDGLLLALGRGCAVGIDLERQRPRPRALAIARRYFAAGERAWLQAQPAATRDVAFLRLWCAKEALLKAHGRGLAFGLDRLVFAERDGALQLHACDPALGRVDDWRLRELSPAPGFVAALAWRPYTAAR
jgi:4'-phosphopantetheinyl transferase